MPAVLLPLRAQEALGGDQEETTTALAVAQTDFSLLLDSLYHLPVETSVERLMALLGRSFSESEKELLHETLVAMRQNNKGARGLHKRYFQALEKAALSAYVPPGAWFSLLDLALQVAINQGTREYSKLLRFLSQYADNGVLYAGPGQLWRIEEGQNIRFEYQGPLRQEAAETASEATPPVPQEEIVYEEQEATAATDDGWGNEEDFEAWGYETRGL